ncbi:MAG: hypothetical protein ACKVQB_07565 [Bacteroidia bacterium]
MKNLKFSTAIVLLVLLTGTFQGCKKGENDPFLSFHSRDARLAGDWEMTDVNSETTVTFTSTSNPTPVVNTSTVTYANGEQTMSGSTSKSRFNVDVKIEKNGQITMTLENFDSKGGSLGITEERGYWVWGSTAKRKSTVVITIKDIGGVSLNGVWNVDQLKNKEIIFKKTNYTKGSNSNSTTESTGETTITFKGK